MPSRETFGNCMKPPGKPPYGRLRRRPNARVD